MPRPFPAIIAGYLAKCKAGAYTFPMRMASPQLLHAARDYRWLLDRDYSAQAALKLVGDRLQLSRDERMILFRGVVSSDRSRARAAIIGLEAEGLCLLVDGYNQALTVMHYLTGRPLFLGSDGLLRDAGGSHGRIGDHELFERAAAALVDLIALKRPSKVWLYLDAPFPGSAGHAGLFRGLLAGKGIEAEVRLERSADGPLKSAPPRSRVATSDGAIADALGLTLDAGPDAEAGTSPRIFDAARWAIEQAYGRTDILDLGELLGGGSTTEAR
jgi:hypothetical protein